MPVRKFVLAPLWELHKTSVFPLRSDPWKFNPFADEVPGIDVPGAAQIRRENLENYLYAFREKPRFLVVGEAMGPRGARFTGVPFTSERMFAGDALPFKGRKTSVQVEPFAERTASIFWRVMTPHFPQFLVWNTLPYHPHGFGKPLSIRTPAVGEIRALLGLIEEVLQIVEPEQILAVGRVAQSALRQLNRAFIPIRHPSHGGAAEFQKGAEETFNARQE